MGRLQSTGDASLIWVTSPKLTRSALEQRRRALGLGWRLCHALVYKIWEENTRLAV